MADEYDLKVIALEVRQTNEDLQDMAHKLYPTMKNDEEGFFLTISGYDDDPRELWQIPETIDLCQRIVKTGLVALLNTSSQIKDLMPERFQEIDGPGPGLGAFEVWIFGEGKMQPGGAVFGLDTMKDFYNMLDGANDTLNKLFTERN